MKNLTYIVFFLPIWLFAQPGPVENDKLNNLWQTLGWVEYSDNQYSDIAPVNYPPTPEAMGWASCFLALTTVSDSTGSTGSSCPE